MRKLYTLLILLFLSASAVFAEDIVYSRGGTTKGKVKSYVDGLILIRENGVEHRYERSMPADYYGDYVKYRKSPFKRETTETNCKIIFVDAYTVHFMKTPEIKIEIPRYRINTMIFNTK